MKLSVEHSFSFPGVTPGNGGNSRVSSEIHSHSRVSVPGFRLGQNQKSARNFSKIRGNHIFELRLVNNIACSGLFDVVSSDHSAHNSFGTRKRSIFFACGGLKTMKDYLEFSTRLHRMSPIAARRAAKKICLKYASIPTIPGCHFGSSFVPGCPFPGVREVLKKL